MKYLFILLFLFSTIISCTKTEENATTTVKSYFYDPKIPGGTIVTDNKNLAGKVLNLTADVSQLNKITLNWQVPPIYKTLSYEVKIYKKTGNDSSFILPDPSDQYSAAPLYLRSTVTGESFLDQNYLNENSELVVEVEQNQTYTYWVYIRLTSEEKWSAGVKIVATSKSPTDTFNFPSATNFWNNILWDIGTAPVIILSNRTINLNTMYAGTPTLTDQVGGIAIAYSGNVMYYADSKNNRVVIYTRGLAYKCDDYKGVDDASYYACVYQYSGAPLTAVNVLGQDKALGNVPDDSVAKSCFDYETTCSGITNATSCDPNVLGNSSICEWISDSNLPNGGSCTAYKRCLTNPTKVSVVDDRLFISDSGNDRIVVYYNPISATNKQTIPIKGHIKDNGSGIAVEIDGGPIMVIGKKGLTDKNSYPIGQSSLKSPGGVTVKDGNLFIADTGNNRIVQIKDYKNEFDCESSPDEWGNLPTDTGYGVGKCRFYSLLGQKNFFEKWSFKEGTGDLLPTDIGYDGIKCTNPTPSSTYCDSPYVLYNQNCGTNTTINSCSGQSACNWISNNSSCFAYVDSISCANDSNCGWNNSLNKCDSNVGSCSLKPEATLRNYLDQENSNKPGQLMSRYFRYPNEISFITTKDQSNNDITFFVVSSNEEASITSPLGTSEVRGRILVWNGNPFPTQDSALPTPPLSYCYSGHAIDNFDIPTSKCHADYVIGQEKFNQLSIVASGSDYSSLTYGLKSLNSISFRNKSLFGVDALTNMIYYWADLTLITNGNSGGFSPTSKVLNPNGKINPNTGRYLPTLKGISDIEISDNNLIYISDPENSKVYEIRAYEYETSQQ